MLTLVSANIAGTVNPFVTAFITAKGTLARIITMTASKTANYTFAVFIVMFAAESAIYTTTVLKGMV